MIKICSAAALAGGLLISLSAASGGTLIPLPKFPGSVSTSVLGMNNTGMLVGTYSDGNEFHPFFGTMDGAYTTFDVPGGNAVAAGINDAGEITAYSLSEGDGCTLSGCQYLRKADGTIVPMTKGQKTLDGEAEQIIDKGKSVGEMWSFKRGVNRLTGYVAREGRYKSAVEIPFETTQVRPRGINKQGIIDGFYRAANGHYAGFVIKDGFAISSEFPDERAFSTRFERTNRNGQIPGMWADQNFQVGQAYLYDVDKDAYDVIDVPGETQASAESINDAGIVTIVGGTSGKSYLYCTRESSCPSSPNAVDIADHWVKAKDGVTRRIVCRNDCVREIRDSLN